MTSDIEASRRRQCGFKVGMFEAAARRPLDGGSVHAIHLFAASLDRG
jgi:hypothetical protein